MPDETTLAELVCKVCGCRPSAPCVEDDYRDGACVPVEVSCTMGEDSICSRCKKPDAFIVTPYALRPPPEPEPPAETVVDGPTPEPSDTETSAPELAVLVQPPELVDAPAADVVPPEAVGESVAETTPPRSVPDSPVSHDELGAELVDEPDP